MKTPRGLHDPATRADKPDAYPGEEISEEKLERATGIEPV
jgi:hypothetical protein